MANIELVIKIPEEIYEIVSGRETNVSQEALINARQLVALALLDSTPLPKGHGKLKDVSSLLTVTDIRSDGSEFTYVPYSEIDDTPTIIEADKAEKEE